MTKFDIMDDFDPNDSHSVNISVYKPDGILSFWNWFTRKNKNETQRKNIKFKINKEDLDRMKLSGFDFQKLQNLAASSKNKSARQCNVFAIPKTDLDPFFMKSLQSSMNTKTFVKRLISKSTISIKSKESCANLKYIRTVRSQKSVVNSVQSSKASFKVSRRSNTNNVNSHSNQQPRNLFLKSVPTTVLKSNTNKLLILGKMKSPKGNRTARTNAPENVNNQQYAKEKNVIPMLLTRMKSMEEHLSDIENTTKKINEAVSQRNVVTKADSRNDMSNTERNRQKAVKCVASHKIYSKNIHAPRKNKKNRPKKLKNKSKTNILNPNNEVLNQLKPPNKGFAFNYFSDSSNESKNANDLGLNDTSRNKPGLFFLQQGLPLPNNIAKVGFSQGDPNSVGCDFIMNVVKALTETKGSTNLKTIESSFTQNKTQSPNIAAEEGVINLGKSNVMSKTTFDWKHTSVTRFSEPHISSDVSKSNQGNNIKVKKNVSATFGQQDVSHDCCQRNEILNQILNPSLQKQIVLELLRNNAKPLPEQDETKTVEDSQNSHKEEHLGTIEIPNTDLEVKECKPYNDNVDDNKYSETGLQEKASTKACLHAKKSSYSTKNIESHKGTDELSLGQEQLQPVGNLNRFQENHALPDVIECSEMPCVENRPLNLQSCEEDGSEITIDRGALCSVSIKQNAVSAAYSPISPGKQFKRTTISCSDAKKDPKVSITILVQDSMKGEVEMKSNLLKNFSVTKDECIDRPLREECSPPLSSCGPRGDQLSIVPSNTCKTESLCSLENRSSVSCTPDHTNMKAPVPKTSVEKSAYSRKNKNFYVEVEDEGKKTFTDEDLHLGSPGTYLTYEKRKVLEEKVLGCKQTMPLVKIGYEKEHSLSPNRSCSNISNGLTSFDHLIETSFIRQETSYSKTKFNICKENKYNSRTSLKPSESCKRCPFSDESLSTENNFDISTKYTSQQCVMYCRNNKVENFRRPEFPLYQAKPLESSEFEKRKLPFTVVHTPKNSRGNLVVNPNNNNGSKIWQKGMNLREDPILEVSEDETVSEKIALNEQDEDETNSIEITTSHGSSKNNLKRKCDEGSDSGAERNITDYMVMSDKKDQKVQHEDSVATDANIRCPNVSLKSTFDVVDSEHKDGLRSSDPRGTTTLTSRISQTEISSALVQTDWSLVGITVDHLNCSSNRLESMGYKKRTVASQTEVMMDQIALRSKDLEEMSNNCCKSCMKSSQFSELVACNVTVSQAARFQEAPKVMSGNRSVPFNDNEDLRETELADDFVVKEKDLNSLECTSSALPFDEDILKTHLLKQVQAQGLKSSKRKPSRRPDHTSHHSENKSEESLLHEDLPHICNIPCLTSLSDETMMSGLSESSYKRISRGIYDYHHTVPQIHAINRGICSYYNTAVEKPASTQLLSPIEESRPSTSETANSAFCRVLGNLDDDDEEFSQDEVCTVSETSLPTSEPVKDSTVDGVLVCPDCPDRLEDEKEPPLIVDTKLEHSLETDKVNVSAKVQGRKTGLKNYTLSRTIKREYSSDKCNDYVIKYLSIERCDEEKKGNSLFSQT